MILLWTILIWILSNYGLYSVLKQIENHPDYTSLGRLVSVFLLNFAIMPISLMIGFSKGTVTWLGVLNFCILQFFCVRLAKKMDNGKLVGYKFLKWIEPYSGWNSDFKYFTLKVRQ